MLRCLRAKNTPKSREVLIQILILLAQLPDVATSMHWIQKIFRYLPQGMDIERGVVLDLVKEHVPLDMEGKIVTIAEQWKQEGEVRGLQKGEVLGRQAIIQRQLTKRFGKTSSTFNSRNASARPRWNNSTSGPNGFWTPRMLTRCSRIAEGRTLQKFEINSKGKPWASLFLGQWEWGVKWGQTC
ncbi:MAG: hypothetical protein EA399_17900 [Desulfovibrionales bacterium]|nr:MAG: hypothetical protein EA399_17900 [Desulfovibrionales bacterium]